MYAENRYGPAPIGLVSISPVPICFGLTIAPSRWAIDSRKSEAPGALSFIVTCVGLSTTTSCQELEPGMARRLRRLRASFSVCSRPVLTASASKGVPSVKVSPLRSFIVTVCGSTTLYRLRHPRIEPALGVPAQQRSEDHLLPDEVGVDDARRGIEVQRPERAEVVATFSTPFASTAAARHAGGRPRSRAGRGDGDERETASTAAHRTRRWRCRRRGAVVSWAVEFMVFPLDLDPLPGVGALAVGRRRARVETGAPASIGPLVWR